MPFGEGAFQGVAREVLATMSFTREIAGCYKPVLEANWLRNWYA